MRHIMIVADAAQSRSLQNRTGSDHKSLLPLESALLERLGVAGPAEMIDKIYSDHSTGSTLSHSETRRKLWIADASRIVFRFAFEDATADQESRAVARSILEEAIQPLVDATVRLLAYDIDPSQSSLSLGGGLWNSCGYQEMLLEKLKERGIEFSEVAVVKSAAEEGAKALLALERPS